MTDLDSGETVGRGRLDRVDALEEHSRVLVARLLAEVIVASGNSVL
jgi:hypothetical protein